MMIMALLSHLVLASSPIVIEDIEGILKLRNAIYVEEYLVFGLDEESGNKKMFVNYATKLEFERGLMISKDDKLVWWITKNHPSGSGYDYYRFSFNMESGLL